MTTITTITEPMSGPISQIHVQPVLEGGRLLLRVTGTPDFARGHHGPSSIVQEVTTSQIGWHKIEYRWGDQDAAAFARWDGEQWVELIKGVGGSTPVWDPYRGRPVYPDVDGELTHEKLEAYLTASYAVGVNPLPALRQMGLSVSWLEPIKSVGPYEQECFTHEDDWTVWVALKNLPDSY